MEIGTLKAPPAEVLTTSPFRGALPLLEINIASTPTAAEERKIAPKFRVSVIPSKRTNNGLRS